MIATNAYQTPEADKFYVNSIKLDKWGLQLNEELYAEGA